MNNLSAKLALMLGAGGSFGVRNPYASPRRGAGVKFFDNYSNASRLGHGPNGGDICKVDTYAAKRRATKIRRKGGAS
jgi:hypothetical protein